MTVKLRTSSRFPPARRILALLLPCLLALWSVRPIRAQGALAQSVTAPLAGPVFVMAPQERPVPPGAEAVFRVVLLDPIGLPLKGVPITVKADAGEVVSTREQAGGLLEVTWKAPLTPPAGGRASMLVSAVLQEKPVSHTFPIELRTADRGSLKLSLGSARLRLGVDSSVKLTIEGRGPDGGPLQLEQVVVRTSVGRVEKLREVKPGRLEGLFLPGERVSPQAAIIAVFLGEGLSHRASWAVLPLVGTPEIPVATEPGSTVWAEVGGTGYGPFKVGPSGSIRIPIQVPPGVREMVLRVVDAAGNTTRAVQDLSVPRFPRALMRLDRSAVRIDEADPVRVSLLLIDDEGRPAPASSARLEVSGGTLGPLVESGPGTFLADWTPPPRPGRQEIRLSVATGEGGAENHQEVLEVREGLPAQVSVRVRPESLRSDDPPAEISVRVLDRAGNPATGVRPAAEAPIGVVEPFRTVGPGEYVSAYRPPSALPEGLRDASGSVDAPIRVSVQRLAVRGAPARIELAARPSVVVAGGEAIPVYARVWDSAGAPVMGARIRATLESGDGSISSDQETDADGRASFRYVPGLKLGPVSLSARVDDRLELVARLLLVQAAREAPELELQSEEAFKRVASGSDLTAETRVSLKAGRVKQIQISALPNVIFMDTQQSSQIKVRLEDAAGNFVIDPTLQLTASAGSLSDWKLSDDGFYTAQYSPPVAISPITRAQVTASNPQREYAGATELQLIRREGLVMGSVRLGVVSNLGGVFSPTLSFQGMVKLPLFKPHLFFGGTAGYYAFSAEVDGRDGSIRYDLLPIQMFACYRLQLGRWTPYVGLGPVAAGYRASLDKALSDTLGLPERAYGLLPGLGGFIGLETGFGPGGIAVEAGISWLKGGDQLQSVIDLDDNAGGVVLQGGYVAHF